MLPSDRSYLKKKKASALRKDVFNRIQERQAKVYTAKSRAPTTTPMVGHSLARSETTRHSKRITCRLGLALNILSSAFTSLSLYFSKSVSGKYTLASPACLLQTHVVASRCPKAFFIFATDQPLPVQPPTPPTADWVGGCKTPMTVTIH